MEKEMFADGRFWQDTVKELKQDNRYQEAADVCMEMMPLPATFNDFALCTRILIKERQREDEPFEHLLEKLYWAAAVEDFLLGTPFVEQTQSPGFTIAESLPEEMWRSLEFPYAKIGFNELNLVNETDALWFVNAWGEPDNHIRAQDFHKDAWLDAIVTYKKIQQKRSTKSGAEGLNRTMGSRSGVLCALLRKIGIIN